MNARMLHENKKQDSMCNQMFCKKVDIEVKGNDATLKLYVAYPVPAFSTFGQDGTVRDFKLIYNNKEYLATSDITTKPKKPAKLTNLGFGFTQGQEIPMQVLTIKLPKEALKEKELIEAGCYVNVIMNTNVKFYVELSNLDKKSIRIINEKIDAIKLKKGDSWEEAKKKLPKQITLILYDKSEVKANITAWSDVDTSKVGKTQTKATYTLPDYIDEAIDFNVDVEVEKNSIKSIKPVDAIKVKRGTSWEEAKKALPNQITLILDDNSEVKADVTKWSDVDTSKVGKTQTKATYTLPDYIDEAIDFNVDVEIEEATPLKPKKKSIKSIKEKIDAIKLKKGDSWEEAKKKLPNQITLILDDNSEVKADVTKWSDVDTSKVGKTQTKATYTLPAYVDATKDFNVDVEIEEAAPLKPNKPTTPSTPSTPGGSSSGGSGGGSFTPPLSDNNIITPNNNQTSSKAGEDKNIDKKEAKKEAKKEEKETKKQEKETKKQEKQAEKEHTKKESKVTIKEKIKLNKDGISKVDAKILENVKTDTKKLTINVESKENKVNVHLNQDILKKLSSNGLKDLKLNSPIGKVSLNKKAIKMLSKLPKGVNILLSKENGKHVLKVLDSKNKELNVKKLKIKVKLK